MIPFVVLQLGLVCFGKIACEEFNLYGNAGQAYAIEVTLGHPHQTLHVLVDTGSATLAIASYPQKENVIYFNATDSSSILDMAKEVEAQYSQGMWVGRLVSDYIKFPSLPSIREVRTDMALITKSHKFFMDGCRWQGLLGLAYLPVGARGKDTVVETWLDAVDRSVNHPMSFMLKLCGTVSVTNATHYGKFQMLEDGVSRNNKMFRTPIIRKRWYEIGVLSIRVITDENNTSNNNVVSDMTEEEQTEMCQALNAEKTIVDSGTTNIRLPSAYFRPVVDRLRKAAQKANALISDEFWYNSEARCWSEPQQWNLPLIAIDLLSSEADHQYFTLEIPPQNYMRHYTLTNSSSSAGSMPTVCYKLGLEAGNRETVLGYTAMEGFEVLFNRSAGWIGWKTSNCGPQVRISGPHNTTTSIKRRCNLTTPNLDTPVSIKAAQWTLCAISIVAAGVLVYLLGPCVKMVFEKRRRGDGQISLSQAALVVPEST